MTTEKKQSSKSDKLIKSSEESWDDYKDRLGLTDDELFGLQLIAAVEDEDEEKIYELLIDLGINPNFQAPSRLPFFGRISPLHSVNNPDMIDYLLGSTFYSLNIDPQDADGGTPLMYAISHENTNLVTKLLELGADTTNVRNQEGHNALDVAQLKIKQLDQEKAPTQRKLAALMILGKLKGKERIL